MWLRIISKRSRNLVTILKEERSKGLDEAIVEDIITYVEKIERENNSAQGQLHFLMNYYNFSKDNELAQCVRSLREKRKTRTKRSYPLKNFLNINQKYLKKLASIGIKNVQEMLDVGKTKKQREPLKTFYLF